MRGKSLMLAMAALAVAWMAQPQAARAQSGRIEIIVPRGALPDTRWMKAEVIGENPLETALRAEADRILRDRGYTVDRTSTYALRIELWSANQAPVPAPTGIPGYANAEPRLSIISRRVSEGQPTYLSLILYHTGSGMRFWQAEAVCYGVPGDAASISRAMLAPLMEYWGKAVKPSSFACRPTAKSG